MDQAPIHQAREHLAGIRHHLATPTAAHMEALLPELEQVRAALGQAREPGADLHSFRSELAEARFLLDQAALLWQGRVRQLTGSSYTPQGTAPDLPAGRRIVLEG